MNIKSTTSALPYLLKTWLTIMPRVLYRSSLSMILDPKGSQRFINHVLNAQDIKSDDPVLDNVDVTDLLGDHKLDICISDSSYKTHTSETRLLKELASLAYIMRVLKPMLVFEIGTYIGRTTRLFAYNSPPACKILTLDLPQDEVSHQIGNEFLSTPQASKITQLQGDSRKFDFSPWYGQCDFIWIDGCHNYEHVVSDTENALKLCSPTGWIAWHDYRHTAWWSGITKYVRMKHKLFPNLIRLKGTTIAVLQSNNP